MHQGVLSAIAGTLLAAVVALSAAPAQAVPISTPAALKSAGDAISLTGNVCWGGCGYGGYGYSGYGYGPPPGYYRPYRPYYSPYYYRPHYYNYYPRPYYGYGYGYRPYYRPYGYGYGYGYQRPVPWWVSGPYYY